MQKARKQTRPANMQRKPMTRRADLALSNFDGFTGTYTAQLGDTSVIVMTTKGRPSQVVLVNGRR